MIMTIYEYRNNVTVCDKVKVVDVEEEKSVFEGTYGNIPIAYADCEVHRVYAEDNVIGFAIDTWDEL